MALFLYNFHMEPKSPSPRAAFIDAFFEGLAAPGLLFCPRELPRLHFEAPQDTNRRSVMETMRDDWRRIGADFDRVIARETASER
jgi:hypothetical protein